MYIFFVKKNLSTHKIDLSLLVACVVFHVNIENRVKSKKKLTKTIKQMSDIKIRVLGLLYNQNIAGTYGLLLSEDGGNRRFSVMIGEPEAQSIAMKLNKKTSETLNSRFDFETTCIIFYKITKDSHNRYD